MPLSAFSKARQATSTVAGWFLRILLALPPTAGLFGAAVAWTHYPVEASLGALVCAYLILGLLFPKVLEHVGRGLGKAFRRPYRQFVGPLVVKPLDSLIVGTGRLIEALVMLIWRMGLWLVGLGLTLGIIALVVWGITKIPVSVAVIIGALIIAGALGAKR